ncbi:hypothetical protein TanjilG_14208 [Lupinus angustifolius]|uniref:(+)-neomenthol dehydrogenase n=1 Tax=Lupinus angustifolius TaxID=3871 RepID=A0A1J7HF82_LUPAN|nr:hypothetical protein TanjilG_14208 [Lupinus angustifolius]
MFDCEAHSVASVHQKKESGPGREKKKVSYEGMRWHYFREYREVWWWSKETVAVVTGGNRGIGFEICRQLAAHGLTVILTSRDASAGVEAIKVLKEDGLDLIYHQLDIGDSSSINQFVNWLQENYGGLDILVNNAGVNFNLGSDNSVENARKRISNAALRDKLSDVESLSEELIDNTLSTFLQQVEDGSWTSGGWPQNYTDYSLSKLAVNAFTRLTARKLSERPVGQKVCVNCYCPGWVRTALTGYAGNNTVEEGADTGVWLALLSDQTTTGKFFAERREINF